MTEKGTIVQRIDSDLIPVMRKYSEGSISDCIRAMERRIQSSQPETGILTKSDKRWIKEQLEAFSRT